jgi:uncharacterized protein
MSPAQRWTPEPEDYQRVFRSQNPWLDSGSVPAILAPDTYRPLAEVLWKALVQEGRLRHQIILGPRRVGKTTVMYQTVRELLNLGMPVSKLWWFRLDHPLLVDWDLGDMVSQVIKISGATEKDPAYLFLDELTYAEGWDLWLKTFYDEAWPVRVVATSSATAAIRQRGNESGVGRWSERYLSPYLFTEYLKLRSVKVSVDCKPSFRETVEAASHGQIAFEFPGNYRRNFLLTGGFPELILNVGDSDEATALIKSQTTLRNDAIEKALYKDIPQAFTIQDPTKLERLLYVLAGQISNVLSPNSISKDLGMSSVSVDRYIGYLERAFIVFTLNNYSPSERSVQTRGKKMYFVDGAVRNAALLRGTAPLTQLEEQGFLLENMVASHLRALAYQEGVRLYHWRQGGKREVDLVYDDPSSPVAFEIASGKNHHHRGITEFVERFPKFDGHCYVVSPSVTPAPASPGQPGFIPLDTLLAIIGEHERAALQAGVGGTGKDTEGQMLLF